MKYLIICLFSINSYGFLRLAPKIKPSPYVSFYKKLSPSTVRILSYTGQGSGFVVSKDGFILTNQHVIANSSRINVQFSDSKKQYPAELIAQDVRADIALIKINNKSRLKPVKFANSKKLNIGENIFSISSPDNYGHSMLKGIVSYIGRDAPAVNTLPLLQLDITLYTGASGGAIFNMRGEVVGMVNAVSRGANGIGFAIPSNDLKKALKDFKSFDRRYSYAKQVYTVNELAKDNGILKKAFLKIKLFFQKINSFIVVFNRTRVELRQF